MVLMRHTHTLAPRLAPKFIWKRPLHSSGDLVNSGPEVARGMGTWGTWQRWLHGYHGRESHGAFCISYRPQSVMKEWPNCTMFPRSAWKLVERQPGDLKEFCGWDNKLLSMWSMGPEISRPTERTDTYWWPGVSAYRGHDILEAQPRI